MRKSSAAAFLFLSVLAMAGCRRTNSLQEPTKQTNNQQPTKNSLPMPTGSPKRPVGMKAIEVKPGGQPAFSQADVATYFKTNNLPRNMGSTDQFQVESVEFITSAEVSRRLQGASTGLPDNDPVAFATLLGTFIFTGPSGSKPATFSRAYALFDAVNGNLLMIGTLESEKPKQ